MVSLKNRQSGFTIVELLIVIVIIGILATLVIVTFTGIQERARNSERQTDINAIQSQLEAFYATQGFYPNIDAVESDAFRGNESFNFTIDEGALRAPRATGTGPTLEGTLGTATDVYYYETDTCTDTNGPDLGVEDAALAKCEGYTLTAVLEGGDDSFVKESN